MKCQHTAWVAVDWGTTNVRAWIIGPQYDVIAHVQSDKGMGKLAPDEFEPALLDLIGSYLPTGKQTSIVCCGMVGARQGWADAGYVSVPVDPQSLYGSVKPPIRDSRLHVEILPGIKQQTPADVMRGEETQIAGFLGTNIHFEGSLCLPGTHTKWVRVRAGRILRFTTCMTGELYHLLSEMSVLRHSLQGAGWNNDTFCEAVDSTFNDPSAGIRQLFSLRAESLLNGVDDDRTRSRLSGLLIGMELGAIRDYWRQAPIVVIGEKTLSRHYLRALSSIGHAASVAEGSDLTLAGLMAAYRKLRERESWGAN